MKIVKVADIKSNPINEQIYDLSGIEELAASIDEVGLLQAIAVNQSHMVISGHRRLEAIKSLGWDEVSVEVIRTKKDTEAALIVHYNKQREKSCREIINEYRVLKDSLPQKSGFVHLNKTSDTSSSHKNTRKEISQSLGVADSRLGKMLFIEKHRPDFIRFIDRDTISLNEAYTAVRRTREDKQPSLAKGTWNILNKNSADFVFHHKSSKQMDEIQDGSVNLVLTSPPYWNKRLYTTEGLGNEKDPDEFVDNLIEHMRDIWRVLNDKGSFFLNLGDTFFENKLQNIPHRVALRLVSQGWTQRNTIIWQKTNPKPQSSKNNLSPTYEFIFHFVKNADYHYQHTLMEQKSPSVAIAPRHRATGTDDTEKVGHPYIPRDGKNMGDYWSEDIVKSAVGRSLDTQHPAPFAEEILILPILQTTQEGDIVLDPFMGAGTAGRVANALGRKFIGYDVVRY